MRAINRTISSRIQVPFYTEGVDFVMAELLPGIDIGVRVEATEFLEQMAVLGENSGKFQVERHNILPGKYRTDIVNFRLIGESIHEDHGFQLIAYDDRPGRVNVEMRAARWLPDPPTEAVYIEAAQGLVGELLRQYNREFSSRYRLRIGARHGKAFAMSERTTTLLERFIILTNISSLHFYDWQRFYALVREGRQEIPDYLLRSHLTKAGFSSQRAAELAEIYTHLWAFKKLR